MRRTLWGIACALLVAAPAAGQQPREQAKPVQDFDDCWNLPEVIARVPAVYPPEALAAGVRGTVLLQAYVTTDGRVGEVRVTKPVAMLDSAAVQSVRQWRFKVLPCNNGRLKAVWVAVPVKFPPDSTGGPQLPAPTGMAPAATQSSSAPPPKLDLPCADVLRHTVEEFIGNETTQGEIDGRAAIWASCRRAETLAAFRDRSDRHAWMERLDRDLNDMNDEIAELAGIQSGGSPGAGHLSDRYHARIEAGFARIAPLWLDGSAFERSAAIADECRALEARIRQRVGAPRPWSALSRGWGGDTVLVSRLWHEPSRRYLENLDQVSHPYDERTRSREFGRASLEILRLLDRMNDELLLTDERAEQWNGTAPIRSPRPLPRQTIPPPPGTPHR